MPAGISAAARRVCFPTQRWQRTSVALPKPLPLPFELTLGVLIFRLLLYISERRQLGYRPNARQANR